MDFYDASLILVGMPGAGKSTIGLLLAKELAKDFIDTDLLIQLREKKSLQEIVNQDGYQRLRENEEQILLSTDYINQIIATGGSAVYSSTSIANMNQQGRVVFE